MITITENEMGLRYRNCTFAGVLGAGRHLESCKNVEVLKLDEEIKTAKGNLNLILKDKRMDNLTEVCEVYDGQVALHFVDGRIEGVLRSGRHAFWKAWGKHEFTVCDMSETEIDSEIAAKYADKFDSDLYVVKNVPAECQGVLMYDGKYVRVLEPGSYFFWANGVNVEVVSLDTRLLQMNVLGQEIMTSDKVSLRTTLVLTYRVLDVVSVVTKLGNYKEQLHVAAQMAVREYVGKYKLDEILEMKEEMSAVVGAKLKETAASLHLELVNFGVKDLILPGEVRDIMNTVLVAEKRAQANLIARREEVASTRSLMNTAKMLEENPTLYKLKELEYMQQICEKIGNITLSSSEDVISQLSKIMGGN